MRNSECGMRNAESNTKPLLRRPTMSSADQNVLRIRTKQFALRVIRFVRSLPRDKVMDEMGRQLLRAGCSTAANYRAACRAKSRPDFVAKMGIVEEESDEALFWMELFVEAELVKKTLL